MLLFDDGRLLKLSDFSTAVSINKITEKWQHTEGRLIYSAAPEVIQEETPSPSSDIWSAMCAMVQMLTSRQPGCHKGYRRPMAMMLLVSSSMEYPLKSVPYAFAVNMHVVVGALAAALFELSIHLVNFLSIIVCMWGGPLQTFYACVHNIHITIAIEGVAFKTSNNCQVRDMISFHICMSSQHMTL